MTLCFPSFFPPSSPHPFPLITVLLTSPVPPLLPSCLLPASPYNHACLTPCFPAYTPLPSKHTSLTLSLAPFLPPSPHNCAAQRSAPGPRR